MNRLGIAAVVTMSVLGLTTVGCNEGKADPQAEAPPPLKLERTQDRNLFRVDHGERFQLTQAVERSTLPELRVTGTVNPDISRAVPVISLATGRVVEIDARLGDVVKKGQTLLKVQSADMSGAFSDYRKAVADEALANTQLDRAKFLFDRGAISQNDLQVAQNAEDKAKVDVENTGDKLRVLGTPNLDHPSPIVEIHAPISGVITDQQVTNAAGVQGLASPNPFTISDLTYVWVLCDVYENDLGSVRVGDKADVHLNAFPDRAFTGTVDNIGPVLDPNTRSAKVRLEMPNPGMMRPGMFATAIFRGRQRVTRAAVPATAILHLHDRDWVFLPVQGNQFRRSEVVGGDMLPGNMQEVVSGIHPGQQVVANALEFQNTVEQQ